MTNIYKHRLFWDERFKQYGHTGESDSLLYAYDQPQRLKAIDRALARAKVSITTQTQILDVGCGTGDVVASLLKYDQPNITGIDLSAATISYTRQRFANYRNVNLMLASVDEMDFPTNSFDLVIGINVLQHVLEEANFVKAVQEIVSVTRPDGHVLIMDFSPIKSEQSGPVGGYLMIRSRQTYIDIFEQNSCRFISEFGLPRLGVRLYRASQRILVWLKRSRSIKAVDATRPQQKPSSAVYKSASSLKLRFWRLIGVLLLILASPFDNWLAPFPVQYTDMRILIFQKTLP